MTVEKPFIPAEGPASTNCAKSVLFLKSKGLKLKLRKSLQFDKFFAKTKKNWEKFTVY